MSLSGIAHPNFKTGRYIKALPDKLAARYLESVNDTELLNMRSDIALIDARIEDLLGSTRQVAYVDLIQNLKKCMSALGVAIEKGDATGISSAIGFLEQTINDGETDLATWDQIVGLLEMRRRLAESERKRLVDMNQMVNTEDAMNLVARLLAAVKETVTDRTQLTRIAHEFDKITRTERS